MHKIYHKKHWNLFGFPVRILLYGQVLCTIRYSFTLADAIMKYWTSYKEISEYNPLSNVLGIPTLLLQLILSLQGVWLFVAVIKKWKRLLLVYYYVKIFTFYLLWVFLHSFLIAVEARQSAVFVTKSKKLPTFVGAFTFILVAALEYFELAQVLRFYSFLTLENEMPIGDYSFKILNEDFNKTAKKFLNSVRISSTRIGVENLSLGEGQFGRVFKGSLLLFQTLKRSTVAIKVIRNLKDVDFESVVTELKILSFVSNKNENLVDFVGCCNLSENHFGIVLEYIGGGSLKDYLSNLKKSDNWDHTNLFLAWSIQIANGMEFLSGKKIIHGDLAARNILLTEDLKCKISDFGMAFKLHQYQNYARSNQTVMPFRWMAPESLSDFKFSTKSDVWSYAVLVWEIFSFGNQPWNEILFWSSDFLKDMESGMKLQKPFLVDDILYAKLLECWALEPEMRPSFGDFKILLENMNE